MHRNNPAHLRVLVGLGTAVVASLGGGCGEWPDPPAAYPPPPPSYETRIEVRPGAPIVTYVPAAAAPPNEWPAAVTVGGVFITTTRRLERATEVVGVIDAHEPSGRQDAAFAVIRERAAAMGADAVVAVEFHHGEEPGEPTHLSGLAVRYLDRTR